MRFSLTFFNPNNWVIGWYSCYHPGSNIGKCKNINPKLEKKNIIADSIPSYHRRNMKWQNQVLSVLLCILN